jgi:hypothetical protein
MSTMNKNKMTKEIMNNRRTKKKMSNMIDVLPSPLIDLNVSLN